MSFAITSINAQNYKVEIFAILFLVGVGFAVYTRYRSLRFSNA